MQIRILILLSVGMLLYSGSSFFCQSSDKGRFDIFKLEDVFDGKGAIIPSDIDIRGVPGINDSTIRFTPNVDEARAAEKILNRLIDMIMGNYTRGRKSVNRKLKRDIWRQYVGIYNNNNEKIIIIVMTDMSKAKSGFIKYWEENVNSITTEETQGIEPWFYHINMKNEQLEMTSDPLINVSYWITDIQE
jgi:hypothetical protein